MSAPQHKPGKAMKVWVALAALVFILALVYLATIVLMLGG